MILISYNDFLNEVHTLNDSEILKNIEKSFNVINSIPFNISNAIKKRDLNVVVLDKLKSNFSKKYDNIQFNFQCIDKEDIFAKEIFSEQENMINILNPKDMGFIGVLMGSCTVDYDSNNKIRYNVNIIFNDHFIDNYLKDKDKYISLFSTIIKHEMIHKEQFSLIINRIKKLNINLDDNEIINLFNGKALKILNNPKSYSSGYKKLKKDLEFIEKNNEYIKYIDDLDDIVGSVDDIEDLVDELRIGVIKTEIVYGTIKKYTIGEVVSILNDNQESLFKGYEKELTKKNKAEIIMNIIGNYNSAIDHDSLKLELDADGYTISHQLEKSLGKEKAKEFIKKPTISKNTPSAMFNYYLNIFGTNTKTYRS